MLRFLGKLAYLHEFLMILKKNLLRFLYVFSNKCYNNNMRKIRKINLFDKPKLKKIMTFMQTNGGTEFLDLMTNVFPGHLHYFLPLKYKFLNESYLLT